MRIFKFFGTSVIATAVDFILYTGLIQFMVPVGANILSGFAGLVTNFFLQKTFVFNPGNSLRKAFVLSLFFSLCGLGLGTVLIYVLTEFTPLAAMPIAAKLITTGVIFLYNYFTKKYAFGHKDKKVTSSC